MGDLSDDLIVDFDFCGGNSLNDGSQGSGLTLNGSSASYRDPLELGSTRTFRRGNMRPRQAALFE